MRLARTIFIWIFGILSLGLFGALIGNSLSTGYANDGGFWGFLAGSFGFCCLRLWLSERRDPSEPESQNDANRNRDG